MGAEQETTTKETDWTDRSLRSDHRTVHTGARKQRTRSLEGEKGVRGA
jgi:hypothetical protein